MSSPWTVPFLNSLWTSDLASCETSHGDLLYTFAKSIFRKEHNSFIHFLSQGASRIAKFCLPACNEPAFFDPPLKLPCVNRRAVCIVSESFFFFFLRWQPMHLESPCYCSYQITQNSAVWKLKRQTFLSIPECLHALTSRSFWSSIETNADCVGRVIPLA